MHVEKDTNLFSILPLLPVLNPHPFHSVSLNLSVVSRTGCSSIQHGCISATSKGNLNFGSWGQLMNLFTETWSECRKSRRLIRLCRRNWVQWPKQTLSLFQKSVNFQVIRSFLLCFHSNAIWIFLVQSCFLIFFIFFGGGAVNFQKVPFDTGKQKSWIFCPVSDSDSKAAWCEKMALVICGKFGQNIEIRTFCEDSTNKGHRALQLPD